jgi:hypothetical protein
MNVQKENQIINTDKIEKQIKEQMKKAFFDLIDSTVNSQKPDYVWITNLYTELRDRLCGFTKKDSKSYFKIIEEFDVELFNQMITNDVFDQNSFLKLVNNTFGWIEKLQAPARDESTKESKNRVLSSDPQNFISTFLKEIHNCLDNLEYDMENYFKTCDTKL